VHRPVRKLPWRSASCALAFHRPAEPEASFFQSVDTFLTKEAEVQIGYGNHKVKGLDHFSLVKDDLVFFLVKAPASDFRRLVSGNAAQDLEILWSYPNVLSWYGYGSRFPAPSADMLDVLLRNCAG
jgi:hypothetical protein